MRITKNKTHEDINAEYTWTLYHNEFRMFGFLLSKIRFLKVLMTAWRADKNRLENTRPEK